MSSNSTIKHHKRTDPPMLIPKSNTFFHGECNIDEKGYPITYEVELWEYPNFLKGEPKFSRHNISTKSEAQKFVQGKLDQRLVVEITVWRIRHTGLGRPEIKRIYKYEEQT